MRRRMAIAAVASTAGLLGGCSLLVNLDGLVSGSCIGVCLDASDETGDPAAADSAIGEVDAGAQNDDGSGSLGEPDTGGGARDATLATDADASREASAPTDATRAIDTGTPADTAPPPVEAACTPAATSSLDDCTALGSLATVPVIDGVLECGVPLWPMPIVGSVGPGPIPSTVQVSIGAAWRPNGLYLFVQVRGEGATRYPPPAGEGLWCGDSVELYVDNDGTYANAPSYDDPGTIQVIIASPSTGEASATVGEMFRNMADLGPWTGKFITVPTSDGFAAEAFMGASDLGLTSWSLAAGGHVGLDVAIDLGAPSQQPTSCPRLAQFTIQLPDPSGASCGPSCDVNEFCAPRLN